MQNPKTFEEYSVDFPEETQIVLENLKNFIQNILPGSNLCIKYGIPTFVVKEKNVVHFGGYKTHIGFYPGAEAIQIFEGKFKNYKTSKGTVQFPLNQEIPWDLIKEIVEHRKSRILTK